MNTILRFNALRAQATEHNIETTIVDPPMDKKEMSLWYGGDVLHLTKDGHTIVLRANGDVRATYEDKQKDGTVATVNVVDKENRGLFFWLMAGLIDDDANLQTVIDNADKEDIFPRLRIENNNWWEAFTYKGTDEIGEGFIVEVETLDEAFNQLIDHFDTYIEQSAETV